MRAALAPSTRGASALAPSSSRRAASVVVAAKPTKAADFRGLSNEEIDTAVAESKRALFDMRIAQRTRQVRFPSISSGCLCFSMRYVSVFLGKTETTTRERALEVVKEKIVVTEINFDG